MGQVSAEPSSIQVEGGDEDREEYKREREKQDRGSEN